MTSFGAARFHQIMRDPFRHGMTTTFLFAVLASGAGCHTQLTYSLVSGSGVTEQQLCNLRYYLCKEVTLARDVTESESRVGGTHSLTIRNGRSIDYVVFRPGTVGKVVASGPNWVDVKFERGDRVLRFLAPTKDPDPSEVVSFQSGSSVVAGEPSDLFRLAAKDWDYGPLKMPWGLTETGWHGRVRYGGKEYYAIEDSFSTCLEIDANSIDTSRKTKRFVTGLDVTQGEEETSPRKPPKSKRRLEAAPQKPAAPGQDPAED